MNARVAVNKKKNIAAEFLKRTASHIVGATGEYISEAMPNTGSIISDSKQALRDIQSGLGSARNNISKIKQLKTQLSFKALLNWYMHKENEFESEDDAAANLDFDIPTDSSEIEVAQISETVKSANKVSQAVIETSHKMVESQISSTANMISSIEGLTAITTSGFNQINATLNEMLKVITKNTATIIETQVAAAASASSGQDDPAHKLMIDGRFNLNDYKHNVWKNIQNSPIGLGLAMLPMLSMYKSEMTPKALYKLGMGAMVNKFMPGLQEGMKAFDKGLNDIIMGSLIRLGGNQDAGIGGVISRIFGINTTRQAVGTGRTALELKPVPFDSLTKEAITQTIPGYLREILKSLSGKDIVYDNRTRSFKSKDDIDKEFHDTASTKNIAYSAGKKFQNLGSYENMLLDLIATKEGWSQGGTGESRNRFNKIIESKSAGAYIDKLLEEVDFAGIEKDQLEKIKKANKNFAKRLESLNIMEQEDLANTIARETLSRKQRMGEYVNRANEYGLDLSHIRDSKEKDTDTVLAARGLSRKVDSSTVNVSDQDINLTGLNYTNSALYEIYRRLNEGINVYQVGSDNSQTTRFIKLADDYLAPPKNYRAKPIRPAGGRISAFTYSDDGSPNDLRDEQETNPDGSPKFTTDEFGNKVPVMKGKKFGERLGSWGKKTGSDLLGAFFSGDPKRIQQVLGTAFRDVRQVAGDTIKAGAGSLNKKAGNFAGYLRHNLTGKGYKYIDDDGNQVEVSDNEKGGIMGYFNDAIFGKGGIKAFGSRIASSGSKWFKTVSSYFDHGDKEKSKGDSKVSGMRRRLLGASVGSLLGAKIGILGGPLGIIMGGLVGNALAQTEGIGGKIKEFLLGSDEKDSEGKATGRKKLGYINKAVNWIVDPIRYQIGKTFTAFSGMLKKNILGPLADIGLAIKDRMSTAAGEVVTKTFSPLFKGIKSIFNKILVAPLMYGAYKFTSTAVLAGNALRAGMGIGGGLIGSAGRGIARSIASNPEMQKQLDERHKGRVADVEMTKAKSGYYGDYNIYEADEYYKKALEAKAKGDKAGYDANMQEAANLRRAGGGIAVKTSKTGHDYLSWKHRKDQGVIGLGGISSYMKEGTRTVTAPKQKGVDESSSEISENTSEIARNSERLLEIVEGEVGPNSFNVYDEQTYNLLRDNLDEFKKFIISDKTDVLEQPVPGLASTVSAPKKETPKDEESTVSGEKTLTKSEKKLRKKEYLEKQKALESEPTEKLPYQEYQRDISNVISDATATATNLIVTPFMWLGQALSLGFKAGKRLILDPILGIGGAIKLAIVGGKTPDGEKVEGLLSFVFNNSFGVMFKQMASTFSTAKNALLRGIIDPISDILWVAKEKTKKGVGNLLFGVKDNYGRRVSDGLFTPFTDALDGVKKEFRTMINNFFSKIFNPITKGIGTFIKGGISSVPAIYRMMIGAFSQEGRSNIANQWGETVGEGKGLFGKLGGFSRFLQIAGTGQTWKEREDSMAAKLAGDDLDIAERLKLRKKKRAMHRGESFDIDNSDMAEDTLKIEDHSRKTEENTKKMVELLEANASGIKGDPTSIADKNAEAREKQEQSNQSISSSLAGAIVTGVSSDGVSKDEQKIGMDIVSDAIRGTSTEQSLESAVKEYLDASKERHDEDNGKGAGGEKKSWWSGLVDGFWGVLKDWKTWVGGGFLLSLLNDSFRNFASGILEKIGTGVGRLWDAIIHGETASGPALVNAVLSIHDAKVDSAADLINPVTAIKHSEQTATGQDIDHSVLTNVKRRPWIHLAQDKFKGVVSSIHEKALSIYNAGGTATGAANAGATLADDAATSGKSATTGKVLGGLKKFGLGIGVAGLGGWATRRGVTAGLKKIGVKDEWAEIVGRASEYLAQYKLFKGAISNTGVGGWAAGYLEKAVKGIVSILKFLGKKLVEIYPAAKGIIPVLDKISKGITVKVLEPMKGYVAKVVFKETTKTGAAAATAGIATAVMGGIGFLVATGNPENLFSVPNGEADALMISIAGTLGSIFDGLPLVGLVEIVDILIAADQGKGLRQLIAEYIYNAITGSDDLNVLQKKLSDAAAAYNNKYGTNLSTAAYNDMMNQNIFKRMWHGNTTINEATGAAEHLGGIKGAASAAWDFTKNLFDPNARADRMEKARVQSITKQASQSNDKLYWELENLRRQSAASGKKFDATTLSADHQNILRQIDNMSDAEYNARFGGDITGDFSMVPSLARHRTAGTASEKVDNTATFGFTPRGPETSAQKVDASKSSAEIAEKAKGELGKHQNIQLRREYWKLELLRKESQKNGKKFDDSTLSEEQRAMLKEIDNMGDAKYNEIFSKDVTGFWWFQSAPSNSRYDPNFEQNSTVDNSGFAAGGSDDDTAAIRKMAFDKSLQKRRAETGFVPATATASTSTYGPLRTNTNTATSSTAERPGGIRVSSNTPNDPQSIRDAMRTSILAGNREVTTKSKDEQLLDKVKSSDSAKDASKATPKDATKTAAKDTSSATTSGASVASSATGTQPASSAGIKPADASAASSQSGVQEKGLPSPYLGSSFRVSSPYGPRILNGKAGFHSGIDLVGAKKDLGAVTEGVVTGVYTKETKSAKEGGRSYGNFVQYQTPDGYKVMNAHMKAGSIPSNIRVGTKLAPGDFIGREGNTGHSYGSHLHFQIEHKSAASDRKGKRTLNPASYLGTGQLPHAGNYTADDFPDSSSDRSGTIKSLFSSFKDFDIKNLLSELKRIGSKFLYDITGGLIGEDKKREEENGASIASSNYVSDAASTIVAPVELLTNAEVRALNLTATEAEILDLRSMTTYKIFWGGAPVNHTDYSTLTPTDTEIKKKANDGKWDWNPRPVILTIGKKCLACATHSYPHGSIVVKGRANPGLEDMPNDPRGVQVVNSPNLNDGHFGGPNSSLDGATSIAERKELKQKSTAVAQNTNTVVAQSKEGWPLGGHFCLWYKDSTSNYPASTGEDYAKAMRAAAEEAYVLGKNLYDSSPHGVPGFISGGTDNESRIYDFFSSKGLSPESIAAIMGTIEQESGFNPKAMQKTAGGGTGKGRGLFQWETGPKGRFIGLEKFAKERGTTWDDLDTQLEFAWKELQNSDSWFKKGLDIHWKRKGTKPYPDGLQGFFKDTNIDNAARAFDAAFTRSANATAGYTEDGKPYPYAGHIEKRVARAKAIYNRWAAKANEKKAPTASISTQSSPSTLSAFGGPLDQEETDALTDVFRDPKFDDDEGGIGGPLDMFDGLLGMAHSTAKQRGVSHKLSGMPSSTKGMFDSIKKELNIPKNMKIPTNPKDMVSFAQSQLRTLPMDQISSSLNQTLKDIQGPASKIKLPNIGAPKGLNMPSTLGDAISGLSSQLRFPQMINDIPSQLGNMVNEVGPSNVRVPFPTDSRQQFQELTEAITKSGDTSNVEALLSSVLAELKSINGNTANTDTMLGSINQQQMNANSRVKNTFKAMADNSKRKMSNAPKQKDVTTVGAIIRGN